MRRAGCRLPTAVLTAAAMIAGCSSVESAGIRTEGMNAEIVVRVTAGVPETHVGVSLRAGTLTFVDLGEGEQLVARAGPVSTTLAKGTLAGFTGYGGRLPAVYAADTEVVVGLARRSTDVSAPNSRVRLPEPAVFVKPASGASFSRSRQDIRIRLRSRPTNQGVELGWAGDCIAEGSIDVAAGQTTVTLARGMIRPAPANPTATPGGPGTPVPQVCKVTLTLTRRVPGILDRAFGGGSIVAETRSTQDISSIP